MYKNAYKVYKEIVLKFRKHQAEARLNVVNKRLMVLLLGC